MRVIPKSIWSFLFEETKYRLPILISVFTLFIGLFVFFHGKIDYIVNLYFGIPVIMATYYYGMTIGVGLFATEALVHAIILTFKNEDISFFYSNHRVVIAFISLFVVVYIVSLFRKVSNRLLLSEKKNKEVSDELQKLNNSKDMFFSLIAHDLRSPIGSIRSQIEMLLDNKVQLTEDERTKVLQALQSLANRVYSLLENLLKWSQIQKGLLSITLERINIQNICNDCILLFQQAAKDKEISIYNKITSELYIMADKNAIETVIRNLLANAIKYCTPGGWVSVSAIEKADTYCIMVTDNGIGMEKELVENLFKIDVDVSRKGTKGEKGTGLGLILAHELVARCHGTLTVESQPTIGSVFKIELPKAE
ncbi:MAG TPA: HAMP domain-containing sensor histidine kinase [Bacteroidales bacterium]